MSDDLHGALEEAHAISLGTKCQKFLVSVSMNPPEGVIVTDEGFRETADRIANKLGLDDHPRVIVVHEKNGRRHAHLVLHRINTVSMTAKELGLFKLKLRDLSKELFLDHGWDLPDGLRTYGKGNPLNFTLEQWQQAQRHGVDPREMKQAFHDAWAQSDDQKSLTNALKDRGLYLAKGDRRGFVALDIDGNIYSLPRWAGVKTKDVKARLGDASDLQSVTEASAWLRSRKTEQVVGYIRQVKAQHTNEMHPLHNERSDMVVSQRKERADLKRKQEERWVKETKARQDRLNGGLRGLFDRITGTHRKTQNANERDALNCLHRDQEQRDRLIYAQMAERHGLLDRVKPIRKRHKQERMQVAKTMRGYMQRLHGSDAHFKPRVQRIPTTFSLDR
ncbi:relaxase [Loktanella sp. D2R18]|nr:MULTISPECIES: relaxase/mobilization nuclease domain-containing protein [Rhodobacterales]MDO6591489.1 relaxase/mobilization nuclease domain-containing protein [Yoonia sp. 1_MG-2023]RBW43897.1 relaxase [Loktanella sp. D2R18]